MLKLFRNISKFSIFRPNILRSLSSYPDALPDTHATAMLHENIGDYRQYVESNDALYSLSFSSKPMRAKSIEMFFQKPFIWPKRLSLISFDGCSIKDEGLLKLCDHIVDAPETLRMLNLSKNEITSQYKSEFAKAISQTKINKINLNHNKIDVLALNMALKKYCKQGHSIVVWSEQGRQIIAPNHQDKSANEDTFNLGI